MRHLAQLGSIALHPIFMFSYGLLAYSALSPIFPYVPGSKGFWITLLGAFILTALAPISLSFIQLGRLNATSLEERRKALTIAILMHGLAYVSGRMIMPAVVETYLLATIISQIAAFFISINSKISMHAVGLSGLSAFGLYLAQQFPGYFYWLFIGTLLLTGLVSSARLLLNAHSPRQIYQGWTVGFAAVYLIFFLKSPI